MWPNPACCFAHTSTGREQEGPLGRSDQLHNADTFSLTSVKLAKKRGEKKELCTSLGIKKKKKHLTEKHVTSSLHVWCNSVQNQLWNKYTFWSAMKAFLTQLRHLYDDSTLACWCYQIQPVTGSASPPKPALPPQSTNATIDHVQQINGPLNKQPCQIKELSESQYNGSRNLLGHSWPSRR